MDKQNVVYSHMEYYVAIKRNEALTPTTPWMKLENIMLSERSHKRPHIV